MPYYGVASGRNKGVYDNWEDCKDQVNRYSNNNYKKFDTPDQARDFVDQHSSRNNDNQVALKEGHSYEASSYERTDYMNGRNGVTMRQHSYKSAEYREYRG